MTSFFDRRKRRKLYQQWTDKAGLSEEDIPDDLKDEGPDAGEIDGEAGGGTVRPGRLPNEFTIHLTLKHILIFGLILVALLVATSSLATILISRSC